jgi:ubiquinone/menaquinone biosynthesis C-methylase UbiE
LQKTKNLLEIGFGAGRNLQLFKNKRINLYGVDISEKMIKETEKNFKGENINLKHLNAEDGLPYKDSFFDLILCIRVLKYMKKWPFVIKEISRSLRKEGIAVLEIPNLFSIHLLGLPWANYFLFFVPNFINELTKNNLEVIQIEKGAIFPFFIYKMVNNKLLLKIIASIDRGLNKILPVRLISRNYMFLVKKVSK